MRFAGYKTTESNPDLLLPTWMLTQDGRAPLSGFSFGAMTPSELEVETPSFLELFSPVFPHSIRAATIGRTDGQTDSARALFPASAPAPVLCGHFHPQRVHLHVGAGEGGPERDSRTRRHLGREEPGITGPALHPGPGTRGHRGQPLGGCASRAPTCRREMPRGHPSSRTLSPTWHPQDGHFNADAMLTVGSLLRAKPSGNADFRRRHFRPNIPWTLSHTTTVERSSSTAGSEPNAANTRHKQRRTRSRHHSHSRTCN